MENLRGRWNHIYKLWENALNQENFPQFDRFLSNEFAKNSKYGSKDRRWYSEVLFAAVRHGYFALFCYEAYLTQNLKADSIQVFAKKHNQIQDILNSFRAVPKEDFFNWVCLRYQFHRPTVQLELKINLEKQKFFNQIIKNYTHGEDKVFYENQTYFDFKLLFHSIPLWFGSYLKKRKEASHLTSQHIDQFLNDLDTRPPLWLRLNHPENKDDILRELKQENYEVEEIDNALKVVGAKGVFSLNAYRNGLFEIQDLASQKIGQHVQAQPKQYVWDCCAGGGGKTLQIASCLKNKGVIYASDIREYKLEEVKKRAKRSGFFNIRCLTWDGENLPQFPKEIQIKGGFHWILVDAPCSSTGTWRRNPDAKYRMNSSSIENLTKLQLSILSQASKAVIKNGYLVYSTCSWLVEENEEVVSQFLQNHLEFSLVEQNLLGNPFANADTMFAAVLEKVK